MSESIAILRGRRHRGPMHNLRLGAAFRGAAGVPVAAFPGIEIPEPKRSRATLVTGWIALLVHAGMLLSLLALVWLNPELVEEIIPVQVLQEAPDEPAPKPRAIAERRPVEFNPRAAAVMPQVVNPQIVPQTVHAEAVELNQVVPIAAPTDLVQADVVARTVTAVAADAVVAQSVIEAPQAAELRTVEAIPMGQSVGPRQIVSAGDTVGTVSSEIRGTSVREGISSLRDVAGSVHGNRVADVNTRVGEGYLAGDGTGGLGIGEDECFARGEVQAYWEGIKQRVKSRWVLPPNVPAHQSVQLRVQLDPGGSTSTVELLQSDDPVLGQSALEAFRAASPFPPMSDRVRCLAQVPFKATFRNPRADSAPLGG
jgi:TonB family protein